MPSDLWKYEHFLVLTILRKTVKQESLASGNKERILSVIATGHEILLDLTITDV